MFFMFSINNKRISFHKHEKIMIMYHVLKHNNTLTNNILFYNERHVY